MSILVRGAESGPRVPTNYLGINQPIFPDTSFGDHKIYPTVQQDGVHFGFPLSAPADTVLPRGRDERHVPQPLLHIMQYPRLGRGPYDVRYLQFARSHDLHAIEIRQNGADVILPYDQCTSYEIKRVLKHVNEYQRFTLRFETNTGLRLESKSGVILFEVTNTELRATDSFISSIASLLREKQVTQEEMLDLAQIYEHTGKFGKEDVFYRVNLANPAMNIFEFCFNTHYFDDGLMIPIVHRLSFSPSGAQGMRRSIDEAFQNGSLDADTIHSLFQYQIIASMEDAY